MVVEDKILEVNNISFSYEDNLIFENISFSKSTAITILATYDAPLCHDFFRYVSHAKKFIADIIAIVNVLFIIVPAKLLYANTKNNVVTIITIFVAVYCLKLFL